MVNDVSNTVSVINTLSNTVVNTVQVGNGPTEVAITPDGAFAYVTNVHDGCGFDCPLSSVSVIATATNTVVATIPVANDPLGVAITPDGRFVLHRELQPELRLGYRYGDQHRCRPSARGPVRGMSAIVGPTSWSITPDGAFAYVTFASGAVEVIATATNTAVASIPDPCGGWDPRGPRSPRTARSLM